MPHFTTKLAISVLFTLAATGLSSGAEPSEKILRVGIIGTDTSHVNSFAKEIREGAKDPDLAGLRLIAAFPAGSPDFAPSRDRVAKFAKELKDQGVEIVDSIDALLPLVDAVMIESVDGRVHLEQVRPVIAAKKPVFVDKPVAGSLSDAIEIFRLAKEADVPCFSSSSLRYATELAPLVAAKGKKSFLGCDVRGPCSYQPPLPDLSWYGIHSAEMLFALMGPGCESVTRVKTKDTDLVVGVWKDGRVGTLRGTRNGSKKFGVVVHDAKGATPIEAASNSSGLMREIAKFFRTGKSPIDSAETLEIFAFLDAAHESTRQNGAPVKLSDVMSKAASGK
jgi:hypothetical protein